MNLKNVFTNSNLKHTVLFFIIFISSSSSISSSTIKCYKNFSEVYYVAFVSPKHPTLQFGFCNCGSGCWPSLFSSTFNSSKHNLRFPFSSNFFLWYCVQKVSLWLAVWVLWCSMAGFLKYFNQMAMTLSFRGPDHRWKIKHNK